jgi:hypothetical protein
MEMKMTNRVELNLIIPNEQPGDRDGGYDCRDWFTDGGYIVTWAEDAATVEEADKILRDAYLGADCDGVTVSWTINGRAF